MFKLSLIILLFVCKKYLYVNADINYPKELVQALSFTTDPKLFGDHLKQQLLNNNARINSKCLEHLLKYVNDLLGLKRWALEMFDATGKIPSGLLRGNGAEIGAFDECLQVQHSSPSMGLIQGKYCLGHLKLLDINEDLPIFGSSSRNKQPRLIDMWDGSINFAFGVCLPQTCSANDFQSLLLSIMHFREDSCQTEESQIRDFDNSDIAAIALLGSISCLILLSTVYDAVTFYAKNGSGHPILKIFSVLSNGRKIISIKQEKTNEISCIYGLRVLSLIMNIIGLRFMLFILSPLINWFDVLRWISDKNKSPIFELIICGDTFLVITGALVSYNYLMAKEQGVKFNVLIYYLNRILRLTPALGITILLHATLLRHMGSGPLWPSTRDSWLINNCREYWWSSLLYVQNYVNGDITALCNLPSWQLSVDMQLFLLSPLILLPLTKAPKYTLSVIGFLLFCSILSPFLTTWVYGLKAVIITNESLNDLKEYITRYFLPTHNRSSAWLVGFLLGYVIYQTRKVEIRSKIQQNVNKYSAVFLWFLSLGVLVLCIMIGREMIGDEYNWVKHGFHIALIRPAWSIAVSFVIFACAHGFGGPVNSFLSAPIFQMLSRISYCTYLMDFSVMFFVTFQTRVGLEFNIFRLFYGIFGDLAFSYTVGLVFTLAFEMPMIAIGHIILGNEKKLRDNDVVDTKGADQHSP